MMVLTTLLAATLTHWAVPALSNEMRLPDAEPTDGEKGAALKVVACRDEFEPASFVLKADADLEGVTVAASDLKGDNGAVIPKAKVDLKVIKVWYQDGNCWYSYFNDVGLRLCPELLLNDETMIKVDEKKKANFIKVQYKKAKGSGEGEGRKGEGEGRKGEENTDYIWVSPPSDIDPGFRTRTEPVNDAKTIQPFALEKNRCKQFFATFRVDKDVKPGLYTGEILVRGPRSKVKGQTADDKLNSSTSDLEPLTLSIPVRLRVLKYVLPDPKTYYDLSADFYTMLYCVPSMNGYVGENGGDRKQSDAKQYARLKNQYDHNVRYPLYFGLWNGYANLDYVENALKQAKEIGMKLDPFFEAWSCAGGSTASEYYACKRQAAICTKEYTRLLGHNNLYPAGGEEPGPSRVVKARNGWKSAHEAGQLVMCNGQDRRYFCGYADDFRVGGGFAMRRESDFMHRIKGKIGNYAGPHTGPENPDFMRRMHGMNLYKKDYDMMYNYGYIEGSWNDLRSYCYRITLVYETKDGFIDTLPWEGMREGIDDIRTATLLLQLADRCVKEGKQKNVDKYYTGRKALQFLANVDEEKCDLAAVRLEMFNHIDKMDKVLGK